MDVVSRTRRATAQVYLLSAVLFAVAASLAALMPDFGSAIEPSGWWFVLLLAVAFGLTEWKVIHFEFRRDAISFSLSEVPLALALVFAAPGPALAARLVTSAVIILVIRRSAVYKLCFNMALFTFELVFAYFIFRGVLDTWVYDDPQMLVAAIVALMVTSTASSVLVAVAISRFQGGLVRRVVAEFQTAWWLFAVNASLAAMVLGLALISPWLVMLAVVPMGLIWYVIVAFGALRQRLADLDAVHGFTGRVGQSLDVGQIAEAAVQEASQLLRSDAAFLVLGIGGDTVIRCAGESPVPIPTGLDDPLWAPILTESGARLIDRRELERLDMAVPGGGADMIVSFIDDDSGPIGLLAAIGRTGVARHFAAPDIARAKNLTEQLASSLRKGMLHQRIEREARHDALTSLPNRSSFERSVARMTNNPSAAGLSFVLMLDLDRFKEVNDTLGHHAGDELLIEVARRVSAQLAPDDVLARLAGDEFAVLANRADRASMIEFAKSCVREVGRPVTLDGLEIVVTASAGLAMLDDDPDTTAPLRHADIAMYNAKSQRLGVEVYRDEIDRRTPARLSMLGDLRHAIEADILHVNFQPKLDLATGTVIGAEALVRWTHPVRGMVPPTQFVRVAEDTGLIKQLTDLMLSRGISAIRNVQDRGYHLGLAVNLSTHDLLDTRLAHRVDDYLAANGVDAGLLTLEITESSLLIDAPRARRTINDLNDIGVRMSIDDFGTGYSSLSYLRRLPVSELKIDRSFVANVLIDEQDEVIVRSTIDLGHNLGLQVVAEGVENNEVLERLRNFGCDVAQGFCISRPLEAKHFMSWLATTSHPSRRHDPLDIDNLDAVPAPQPDADARTEMPRDA